MICATAFPKVFNDAPGANEIGTFLIYIFFAVIGAPASIMSIITQAPLLLVYALIIVACNMLITLIFGKIFKFSLEEIKHRRSYHCCCNGNLQRLEQAGWSSPADWYSGLCLG